MRLAWGQRAFAPDACTYVGQFVFSTFDVLFDVLCALPRRSPIIEAPRGGGISPRGPGSSAVTDPPFALSKLGLLARFCFITFGVLFSVRCARFTPCARRQTPIGVGDPPRGPSGSTSGNPHFALSELELLLVFDYLFK